MPPVYPTMPGISSHRLRIGITWYGLMESYFLRLRRAPRLSIAAVGIANLGYVRNQ